MHDHNNYERDGYVLVRGMYENDELKGVFSQGLGQKRPSGLC